MPANRLYYHLKPYLPWRFRMALRRIMARRKRKAYQDVWPINEAAGRPPASWPGWPDGKRFAFVLTHDVESQKGLDRCLPLSELDASLGFRSSFNFILKEIILFRRFCVNASSKMDLKSASTI